MSARTQVRLKIFGRTVEPGMIAKDIGIEPDRSRRAGDFRGPTRIIEETGLWEIQSGLDESAELPEHLDAIFERIRGREERIAKIAETADVVLSCVLHATSEPPIALGRDHVQTLAKIQAELDVDLYIEAAGDSEASDSDPGDI